MKRKLTSISLTLSFILVISLFLASSSVFANKKDNQHTYELHTKSDLIQFFNEHQVP